MKINDLNVPEDFAASIEDMTETTGLSLEVLLVACAEWTYNKAHNDENWLELMREGVRVMRQVEEEEVNRKETSMFQTMILQDPNGFLPCGQSRSTPLENPPMSAEEENT